MPRAAYCNECARNVWLGADGGCTHGHPRSSLRHEYEAGVDPAGGPVPPSEPAPTATVHESPLSVMAAVSNRRILIPAVVGLVIVLLIAGSWAGWRAIRKAQERSYAKLTWDAMNTLSDARKDWIVAGATQHPSDYPQIRRRVDDTYDTLSNARPPARWVELHIQLLAEARHLSAAIGAEIDGDVPGMTREIDAANRAVEEQNVAFDRLKSGAK